jgi:hypothetical protein
MALADYFTDGRELYRAAGMEGELVLLEDSEGVVFAVNDKELEKMKLEHVSDWKPDDNG